MTAPHWQLLVNQGIVNQSIRDHEYRGSGTEDDPYIVEFIQDDPQNPIDYPRWRRWGMVWIMAFATLAVAFVSSAYAGGIPQILVEFQTSPDIATLGISMYVLGFAIGPLVWAPLSELYGRQVLFVTTFGTLTAFTAAAAASQNIQTMIVLRFLAGAFGSSPLTNAGGVISDLFDEHDRGIAGSLFAVAPFAGPVMGPVVGGFVGPAGGWRWVFGVMAIFTAVLWVLGSVLVPETYAPVILRKRALKLSRETSMTHISIFDATQERRTPTGAIGVAMARPWTLLFREPIVFLSTMYLAIVYGTLYMLFAAFPIVFQQHRHWTQGISGLAFLGIFVGMLIAVALNILYNKRYVKIAERSPDGIAPPEARLPLSIVGAINLPLGLFIFAWTNGDEVHWIVPIIGSIPFGTGMVLVFLSMMAYLIDSYAIYAASVLAANSLVRSLFGAVFPLFTNKMYESLGIHWASSVPAFLAVACIPCPFLFYKFGGTIRKRSKHASEAAATMEALRRRERSEKHRPGDATPKLLETS